MSSRLRIFWFDANKINVFFDFFNKKKFLTLVFGGVNHFRKVTSGIVIVLIFLLFIFLFIERVVAADPPAIINYQGKLLDNGASATTTYSFGFVLFDDETLGSILYTASGTLPATSTVDITPEQGIFSVNLGDGTLTNSLPAGVFANNEEVFLQVYVDGTPLLPRKRIVASPYSLNSRFLSGFGAATASTSAYVPVSDDFGNLTFTGTPTTTGVGGGVVYINPSAAVANRTLFGVAVGGVERLRLDTEGDAFLLGGLTVSGTITGVGNLVASTGTFAGALSADSFTASSSTISGTSTLGALVVGGPSILNNLSLSGVLGVVGTSTLATTTVGGTLSVASTTELSGPLNVSGVSRFSTTTEILANLLAGAVAETITNGSFVMNGNDAFVADLLGVGGSLFVENNIFASGTLNITGTSTLGQVVASALTLGGVSRSTWPTAAEFSPWTTSTDLLYPDSTLDRVLIGGTSTSTAFAFLEVLGGAYFAGALGVGTTTPAADFAVDGTGLFGSSTTILGNLLVGGSIENLSTTTFVMTGDDAFVADLLGVGDAIFVENDIFIGTSTLRLNGAVTGGMIAMTNGALTINSDTRLNFNTTNNQNVIFGSGNVGIGTSTPDSVLTVAGTARVTGTTTLGGVLAVSATTTLGSGLTVSGTTALVGAATLSSNLSVAGNTTLSGALDVRISEDNIELVGTLVDDGSTFFGNATDIKVVGNYAYALGEDSLQIFDVSDPANPTAVGSFSDGSGGAMLSSPYEVEIQGQYAYVTAEADNALSVIDISVPSNPTLASVFVHDAVNASMESPRALELSGKYAYVLAGPSTNALVAIDISDPYNPLLASNNDSLISIEDGSDLKIKGDDAYVYSNYFLAGSAIRKINDIPTPYEMYAGGNSIFGQLDSSSHLDLQGNYLYALGVSVSAIPTFYIFNINGSFASAPIGTLPESPGVNLGAGNPGGLEVSGQYAFVGGDGAVTILDVSSSTNPVFVAEVSGISSLARLDVAGNYIYAIDTAADTLLIYRIGGINSASIEAGSVSSGRIKSTGHAQFLKNVDISGGLFVGESGIITHGDIFLNSTLPSFGTVSTNTLKFSHTALFESFATGTATNAFVFNSAANLGSTNFVLSVRNNNTNLFSVRADGRVDALGSLNASSATVGTPGTPGDLAERVDVAPEEMVEAGDVLVVDERSSDVYRLSRSQNDPNVAGVVSTLPTIVVGNGRTEHTTEMAMVGRVPVKVSDENGVIRRGDLLVTSGTPGRAMRFSGSVASGPIAIIGVALEDSDSRSDGKIMSLIRSGWLTNYELDILSLREEIRGLASMMGENLSAPLSSVTLSVEEENGLIQWRQGSPLDLFGGSIVNVASISGLGWEIDEFGRFVTVVRNNQSADQQSLYAVQSQGTSLILSGSDVLEGGMRRIDFGVQAELIDPNSPIKVTVTLTGDGQGVYVSDKSYLGFVVRELGGGTGSAGFDWVAVVERRLSASSAETNSGSVENNPPESQQSSMQTQIEVPVEETSTEQPQQQERDTALPDNIQSNEVQESVVVELVPPAEEVGEVEIAEEPVLLGEEIEEPSIEET